MNRLKSAFLISLPLIYLTWNIVYSIVPLVYYNFLEVNHRGCGLIMNGTSCEIFLTNDSIHWQVDPCPFDEDADSNHNGIVACDIIDEDHLPVPHSYYQEKISVHAYKFANLLSPVGLFVIFIIFLGINRIITDFRPRETM